MFINTDVTYLYGIYMYIVYLFDIRMMKDTIVVSVENTIDDHRCQSVVIRIRQRRVSFVPIKQTKHHATLYCLMFKRSLQDGLGPRFEQVRFPRVSTDARGAPARGALHPQRVAVTGNVCRRELLPGYGIFGALLL